MSKDKAKADTKKAPSKEVAKPSANLPAYSEQMPDFMKGNQSNRGSEEVGASDVVIPRLELVQSLSPCRKKNDPSYIEGAEEGMLYNNVTRELYGDEVMVVPVFFRKEYLLWKKRTDGGGFKGAFPSMELAEAARSAMDDADKIDVVDTAQHFCLLLNGNSVDEVVISMSKSKMKMSRNWNSLVRIAGGDRFSRVYCIRSVEDSGEKGDFFNLGVVQLGFAQEPIYRRAEKLYEMISTGAVQADHSGDDVVGSTASDDSEM